MMQLTLPFPITWLTERSPLWLPALYVTVGPVSVCLTINHKEAVAKASSLNSALCRYSRISVCFIVVTLSTWLLLKRHVDIVFSLFYKTQDVTLKLLPQRRHFVYHGSIKTANCDEVRGVGGRWHGLISMLYCSIVSLDCDFCVYDMFDLALFITTFPVLWATS